MEKTKKVVSFFKKNFLFFLVVLILTFLRIFNLYRSTMFLSDQGRDAIIIRNIVTLKHFPAIGAPTSIGQVYLGPFYYYLIAPFLLIFNFNPVGLSYAVAILSIFSLILIFFLLKKEVNEIVAWLFLIIAGFSKIIIEQSRYSWNPNLLPYFSFLTIYFFYKLQKEKKLIFAILFGSFFSFSLQLHYLAILIFPPIFIYGVYDFFKLNPKWRLTFFYHYLNAGFFFLFFSFPLLIFDFRHNFLNFKNFLKLFTEQNLVGYQSKTILYFLFFIIFFIFIFLKRKKINNFVVLCLLQVALYFWGFKFLNAPAHIHYFGAIYMSVCLIISYLLFLFKKVFSNKVWFFFIAIFAFFYLFFNFKEYRFLTYAKEGQIAHSKKVAEFLADKIGNQPFNIATWPVDFTEDNYVYFLILKGLKPADRQKLEITNQMYVLCNKEPCLVINSPSWNISMFGKAKIDKIWEFEGLKIYKLIHEK